MAKITEGLRALETPVIELPSPRNTNLSELLKKPEIIVPGNRILNPSGILSLGGRKPSPAPDLHQYSWVVINSSGGKDSQTAMNLMMREVYIQGYPESQVIVSHQDLGEMEWPGTTELALEQASAHGLPVEISRYRNNVGESPNLLDYVLKRGMWPSSDARFCTSEFKRGPGNRLLTKLRKERPGNILQVFGFRAEESPNRKKKPVLELNLRASTRKGETHNFLNIHKWTTQDVWEDIHESGIRYHWAYDIGMPRLSCAFCIMAPEAALALAARHLPELFLKYLRVEEETGHRFTDKFSLRQIADKLARGEYPEHLTVSNWKM